MRITNQKEAMKEAWQQKNYEKNVKKIEEMRGRKNVSLSKMTSPELIQLVYAAEEKAGSWSSTVHGMHYNEIARKGKELLKKRRINYDKIIERINKG